MDRRWKIGLIAAMIGFIGYIIYGSMARVERQCELCIEYRGQTECRSGAGATDEEARAAATMTACAELASGMAESINCQNTWPKSIQCQGG